jgi:hypothetical protein
MAPKAVGRSVEELSDESEEEEDLSLSDAGELAGSLGGFESSDFSADSARKPTERVRAKSAQKVRG